MLSVLLLNVLSPDRVSEELSAAKTPEFAVIERQFLQQKSRKEKPKRMTAGVRYTIVPWAERTHMKKVRDSHTAVPEGFQVLNL
jgi:hypothetical protein